MRTILDNIKRDILNDMHVSLTKKSISTNDFKSTFKFVSDDNKIIGDFIELDEKNLPELFNHLIRLDKTNAKKKFLIFDRYSISLNKLAKDFSKITHVDFYYMNDNKTYKLPADSEKAKAEELAAKRKRLLSIGTWDAKSLKEIEKAKNGFGKWRIEKY